MAAQTIVSVELNSAHSAVIDAGYDSRQAAEYTPLTKDSSGIYQTRDTSKIV